MYAAIGGMQLQRWQGYFKIIWPTMRVLRAAKKAEACIHADTFKSGDVFFAVSVWENEEALKAFAKSGLHATLMSTAMDEMAMFFNHTERFAAVPGRDAAVAAWQAAIAARQGAGTVGRYKK